MNGTVSVFCVKHDAKCVLKDKRVHHEDTGGYCDGGKFLVRREREVDLISALNELRLAARARGGLS